MLFFRLSFSGFSFEEDWNFVGFEVGLGEGSEMIEGGQDFSFFVVKADFFVYGAIVGNVGVATKDSKIGIFVFVGFFGGKLVVIQIEFEIVQEEDISDFDGERKVFFAVAPEVLHFLHYLFL